MGRSLWLLAIIGCALWVNGIASCEEIVQNPQHSLMVNSETSIETPTVTPLSTITPIPSPTPTETQVDYVNKFPVCGDVPGNIHDLDFIPESNRIITLDEVNNLRFWEKNPVSLLLQPNVEIGDVTKIELTCNGKFVWVSGCIELNLIIIKVDAITGLIIKEIEIGENITTWDIDNDEKHLFYAKPNKGIFEIDLETDQRKQIYQLSEGFDYLYNLILSPDNSELAIVEWTNSYDQIYESRVVIWDITQNQTKREFHYHKYYVDKVLWTQDGDYLYFQTIDRTDGSYRSYSMELFEKSTGHHIGHLYLGDKKGEVELAPDGVRLLFSEWNKKGVVALVDFFSGEILHKFHHQGHVYSMAFNQDGTEILTGTYSSSKEIAAAYLWDICDIPAGEFPDSFVASTPTPTMTITPTMTFTPTRTPDRPHSYPTEYQLMETDLKADLLAINPVTDDIVSTYFETYPRRFFITTPSGDKTEITPDSEEAQQILSQSFNDMCVSEQGVIYFIGDELVEFDPNRIYNPVRQFDISGRKIHVVAETDRIPGATPGMLIILRTPDNKNERDEFFYLGHKENELLLFNPQSDPATREILFTGEEFLRGVIIADMTIGPENRLFFITSGYINKIIFLNDKGCIEEYSHLLFDFGYLFSNSHFYSFIYSPIERSFFLQTYCIFKIPIDDLSEIKFASTSYSSKGILESSISGDKIFVSHRKRFPFEDSIYVLTTETAPATPTPPAIIPKPTPTPIKAWFVLDGFGGIHTTNDDVKPPVLPYFMNYNIVRDIEPDPQGKGWYMLDGFGGIHQSSTEMQRPPIEMPYFGFDIARNLEVKFTDGEYKFYMLDGYGGIHTNDEDFKFINLPWNDRDVMRDLEPVDDSNDWMVMDDRGLIYRNDTPQIDRIYYCFFSSKIMRSFVRFPDDRTVMIDFYGGRHTNSYYPANDVINGLPPGFYFPGWEIIWDVEIVPENMIE